MSVSCIVATTLVRFGSQYLCVCVCVCMCVSLCVCVPHWHLHWHYIWSCPKTTTSSLLIIRLNAIVAIAVVASNCCAHVGAAAVVVVVAQSSDLSTECRAQMSMRQGRRQRNQVKSQSQNVSWQLSKVVSEREGYRADKGEREREVQLESLTKQSCNMPHITNLANI